MKDRLFLTLNCPECARVKAELDFDRIIDEKFLAKDGQELCVYSALSNSAAEDLLEKYNLDSFYMPVLMRERGSPIQDAWDIILYLREQGAAGAV